MDSARSNLVTGISGPEPEPHHRIWVIESRAFTGGESWGEWRPMLSHVQFHKETAEWQVREILAESPFTNREYRVVPYVAE